VFDVAVVQGDMGMVIIVVVVVFFDGCCGQE